MHAFEYVTRTKRRRYELGDIVHHRGARAVMVRLLELELKGILIYKREGQIDMPLLDPIEEAIKPKMSLDFCDRKVPENIKPILTLMKARATSYMDKTSQAEYWEITTADGMHYVRAEANFLDDSEEEWTKMIGYLLDYAKQQSEKS